jgi:hypothetical protein
MANITKTKGHWILKNIKTHWIFMFLPAKRILPKYQTLVLKMHQDVGIIIQVAHNLELFSDLEVMFRFSCIMPLFKGLNKLIKFSLTWQCFVCDFVVVVKLC